MKLFGNILFYTFKSVYLYACKYCFHEWLVLRTFAINFWLLKHKLYKYLFIIYFQTFPGLDVPKHGEPAYPYSSYGDGWGESPPTVNGSHGNRIGLTNQGANVTAPSM